jgi:hypothetical protein
MDRWTALFDYMSGGSWPCCGIAYSSMLFGSTNELIQAGSDLEEVDVHSETRVLEQWPKDLRDQVWSDRIRLRQRQKLRISHKAFQKKLELLVLLDVKHTTYDSLGFCCCDYPSRHFCTTYKSTLLECAL